MNKIYAILLISIFYFDLQAQKVFRKRAHQRATEWKRDLALDNQQTLAIEREFYKEFRRIDSLRFLDPATIRDKALLQQKLRSIHQYHELRRQHVLTKAQFDRLVSLAKRRRTEALRRHLQTELRRDSMVQREMKRRQ